jgi:LysM repeat protein
VKKGETLDDLAQRFSMTVPEIKKMNLLKGNKINSGKILRVTRPTDDGTNEGTKQQATEKPKAEKNKTYTVKKGDNLYRIARKNNVSVSRLMKLNGLAGKEIKSGQVIIVK